MTTLEDCAICLFPMKSNSSQITALACAHCFHTICVNKLCKHSENDMIICPLCRDTSTQSSPKKQKMVDNENTTYIELDIQAHEQLEKNAKRKRRKRGIINLSCDVQI